MLKNLKYGTFGLKQNWLYMFLQGVISLSRKEVLGPRQYDSLIAYLQDMELINRKRDNSFLDLIKKIHYQNRQTLFLWSCLWVNLAFNSNLFNWWCNQNNDTFSREKIFELMSLSYKKQNRYLLNALNSLISTFEYTPIGSELKIGIVWREKNKRFVKKEGGYPFDPYVILYALYKYAQKKQIYEIDIDNIENEIFSPQKVLVIESKYVKNALLELNEPDMIKTNVNEENHLIVTLNNQFHPYDVIRKYIEKEQL